MRSSVNMYCKNDNNCQIWMLLDQQQCTFTICTRKYSHRSNK